MVFWLGVGSHVQKLGVHVAMALVFSLEGDHFSGGFHAVDRRANVRWFGLVGGLNFWLA